MSTISLLVVQPTAFCNIDCGYCYLGERTDKRWMSFETLETVFAGVFQSTYVGKTLRICWHAGEPTVLPVSYYERAFSIISRLCPDGIEVEHLFQTNATLVDEDWCRLFSAQPVRIGVSLDGPREIHDAHRKDRRGRGTFEATMRGMSALKRNDVPFHVICVLSRASLDHPDKLFDFFAEHEVQEVCFNVEEQEGVHAHTSLTGQGIDERVSDFFDRYYRRLRSAGFPHWVREIDVMMQALMRADLDKPQNVLASSTRSINVDRFGNVSTFSPELLGVETERYGRFAFGNLTERSLEECLADGRLRSVEADIAAGVEMCRQTCPYFGLCGGGAPANKLFENGTFASTETQFCRLTVKRLADLAVGWIEEAVQRSTPR